MKARLVATSLYSPLPQIAVEHLPLTIGRGANVVVRLDDRWVSRRHCVISEVNDVLVIRDLESTHGTLVNGKPVRSAPLVHGDRLQLGLSTFVVEYLDESSAGGDAAATDARSTARS